MAKTKKIPARPTEWTAVVSVELSLREAMMLQAILGATNGDAFTDLWEDLKRLFGEHDTGARFDLVDLNKYASLFDKFGVK